MHYCKDRAWQFSIYKFVWNRVCVGGCYFYIFFTDCIFWQLFCGTTRPRCTFFWEHEAETGMSTSFKILSWQQPVCNLLKVISAFNTKSWERYFSFMGFASGSELCELSRCSDVGLTGSINMLYFSIVLKEEFLWHLKKNSLFDVVEIDALKTL